MDDNAYNGLNVYFGDLHGTAMLATDKVNWRKHL
jgi:hypothetical protein